MDASSLVVAPAEKRASPFLCTRERLLQLQCREGEGGENVAWRQAGLPPHRIRHIEQLFPAFEFRLLRRGELLNACWCLGRIYEIDRNVLAGVDIDRARLGRVAAIFFEADAEVVDKSLA